jgi:hypothetical protein
VPWWEDESKLKALSAAQLSELWQRAGDRGTEAGKSLQAAIEQLRQGLGTRKATKPIVLDDPLGKRMERTIFSPEGRRRVLDAQNAGLPPLAGIDPLLQEELRKEYSAENEATIQAGYLVTKLMEQKLGYRKLNKSADLPSNCIARSGQLFEPAPARKPK